MIQNHPFSPQLIIGTRVFVSELINTVAKPVMAIRRVGFVLRWGLEKNEGGRRGGGGGGGGGGKGGEGEREGEKRKEGSN